MFIHFPSPTWQLPHLEDTNLSNVFRRLLSPFSVAHHIYRDHAAKHAGTEWQAEATEERCGPCQSGLVKTNRKENHVAMADCF